MSADKKGFIARTPLQSKKFIAAMTWSLCWLLLLKMGIDKGLDPSVLSDMIYATGAAQLCYIGGQSLVDSWVKSKLASRPSD